MAFATWPATLPPPLMERKQQFAAGLLDEAEQMYPQRTRERPEHNETVGWMMTAAQMAAFRTFVDTTLSGGGAVFTADWLAEMGYTDHVARVVMPYAAELLDGGKWRVGAGLEIISLEAA